MLSMARSYTMKSGWETGPRAQQMAPAIMTGEWSSALHIDRAERHDPLPFRPPNIMTEKLSRFYRPG
ncbi:Hypothetical protein GbCGDNIH4_5097 [Granulibacter bethesdensis CGDNIH4]|nr:Hypothetical protein GbCGDNIH4_5097 [Granulibacter bethesdensis CGDNIH4]